MKVNTDAVHITGIPECISIQDMKRAIQDNLRQLKDYIRGLPQDVQRLPGSDRQHCNEKQMHHNSQRTVRPGTRMIAQHTWALKKLVVLAYTAIYWSNMNADIKILLKIVPHVLIFSKCNQEKK